VLIFHDLLIIPDRITLLGSNGEDPVRSDTQKSDRWEHPRRERSVSLALSFDHSSGKLQEASTPQVQMEATDIDGGARQQISERRMADRRITRRSSI
jgi:hypothetical protein